METELVDHVWRNWRRWSVISTALLLLLAAGWFTWYETAERRLSAAVARMKANGHRLAIADFTTTPIPDSSNAAVQWAAVYSLLPADTRAPSESSANFGNFTVSIPDYPPPPQWTGMADQSAVVCAAALKAADAAAVYDQSDLGNPVNTWVANLSRLNQSRTVANVLCDAAVRSHLHKDDVTALRYVHDSLRLGNVFAGEKALVADMVGIGILARSASTITLIAPDLQIDDATRPVVSRVIDDLLAGNHFNNSAEACVEVETAGLYQSDSSDRAWSPLIRPGLKLMLSRTLANREIDFKAAEAADNVAAQQIETGAKYTHSIYHSYDLFPSQLSAGQLWPDMVPSSQWGMGRYIETRWKGIVEARAMGITLAIQLYRADHHQFPNTLNDLVPAYLPAVPLDPFRPAPTPIGYLIVPHGLPDGGPRHLLFFATTGGTPPKIAMYCWNQTAAQWRDLDRR